jgi:uncharacterized membrane protein (DUF485 family)
VEASQRQEAGQDVDWQAIEESPEFQELVRRRKAFVLPGTVFYLAWYTGFILLTAYAEDFMARSVYQGLTVGYCLALTQFVMVVVLGIMYLRKANTVFDPLAEKAVEKYAGRQRFTRKDEQDVGSRAATPTTEAGR